MTNSKEIKIDLDLAKRVLDIESKAVEALSHRLDQNFIKAVELLANCSGRVIVTGMGKSGIISRKIAATFSSTGTAAYFVHPAEAVHGDLGAIKPTDLIVALSYSGETPELLRLLETIKRLGARIIAITGNPKSPLGKSADVTLDCHVDKEACPLNLAPTASTTAALALGDALAMTLLKRKGFREEDFANLHPGGHLGKRLLRVDRLMHSGSKLPTVRSTTNFEDILSIISKMKLGMTCVTDDKDNLLGVITDGDVRRAILNSDTTKDLTAETIMSTNPKTVQDSTLAAQALNTLESKRVTSLVVLNDNDSVVGVLHLHDLWRTELF